MSTGPRAERDPLDYPPGAGAAAQAALRAERWADPEVRNLAEWVVAAPAWPLLVKALRPAGWSPCDQMTWVVASNAYLEGRCPAEAVWDDNDALTPALTYAVERALPGQEPLWM